MKFTNKAIRAALSRPGPIGSGMAEAYKRGGVRAPLALASITKETRGLFLFREQIEEALTLVGGLSRIRAARTAKLLSRKSPEEKRLARRAFLKGAAMRGYSAHAAEKVFCRLDHYAGYACSYAALRQAIACALALGVLLTSLPVPGAAKPREEIEKESLSVRCPEKFEPGPTPPLPALLQKKEAAKYLKDGLIAYEIEQSEEKFEGYTKTFFTIRFTNQGSYAIRLIRVALDIEGPVKLSQVIDYESEMFASPLNPGCVGTNTFKVRGDKPKAHLVIRAVELGTPQKKEVSNGENRP